MPKFEITFEREVVQIDRFTRVIEAATIEEAWDRARLAEGAYDHDCPDDAKNVGVDECRSWNTESVMPTSEACDVDELPSEDDDDDGCPVSDPECLGNNGDCHDACQRPD